MRSIYYDLDSSAMRLQFMEKRDKIITDEEARIAAGLHPPPELPF